MMSERKQQTDFPDDFVGDVKQNDSDPPTVKDSDPKVDADPPVAKDVDGIPYCCDHHVRMARVSGGKRGSPTTYYKCPVKDCDAKAQMIRTIVESVVPPNPVACPRCSKGRKVEICVRDPRVSNAGAVILKCPRCEWKSNAMAVPQLAAQHFAARNKYQRPPVADLGER